MDYNKINDIKRKLISYLCVLFCGTFLFFGCGQAENAAVSETQDVIVEEEAPEQQATSDLQLDELPAYSGQPYVTVNGNVPLFTEEEISQAQSLGSFETYSDLDTLGRCGTAYANIGQDLMPTEDRESISEVIPSGWENESYDFVDGGWVYNRCHLIGFQLTGENANEENLITGTRYMNVDGMLPFENMVADYIKETGNHVLYRVSPIFTGNNLLADGVLMEGYSLEDGGDGILFCVYCYNVQPGVSIDYATGENHLDTGQDQEKTAAGEQEETYILNTNTKKYHRPDCSSVEDMKANNRQDYTGTREDLIAQGYSPCGNCDP